MATKGSWGEGRRELDAVTQAELDRALLDAAKFHLVPPRSTCLRQLVITMVVSGVLGGICGAAFSWWLQAVCRL